VADPTLFHPKIIHPKKLLSKSLCPEQIGVSLEERHDVVGIDLRENPFFLGPNTGPVGPRGVPYPRVEQSLPVLAVVFLQSRDIVLHIKESPGSASIYHLVERVVLSVGGWNFEHGMGRGEGNIPRGKSYGCWMIVLLPTSFLIVGL